MRAHGHPPEHQTTNLEAHVANLAPQPAERERCDRRSQLGMRADNVSTSGLFLVNGVSGPTTDML
jgi:hypothetical protein